MKRDRVFIGQTDLDGSGFVVLLDYFQIPYDDILIEEYSFFDDDQKIDYALSFKELIFIDFSPDQRMADKLLEQKKQWKVFDHHEGETRSFLKELPESNLYEINIDMEECGTSLFFKEFIAPNTRRIKPIVKEYVNLIKTYDMWKQDDPLWEEALNLNRIFYRMRNYNALVEYEAMIPFLEAQIRKFQYRSFWTWTEKELQIIKSVKEREKKVYEEGKQTLHFRKDHRGKLFGVWDGPSKISLTCSAFLKEYPELDYIIAINTWGGLSGKMSFRSSRGFNCNEISVANGHDAAAGSQIDVDLIMEFINNKELCFAYKDECEYNPEGKIVERRSIFKSGSYEGKAT